MTRRSGRVAALNERQLQEKQLQELLAREETAAIIREQDIDPDEVEEIVVVSSSRLAVKTQPETAAEMTKTTTTVTASVRTTKGEAVDVEAEDDGGAAAQEAASKRRKGGSAPVFRDDEEEEEDEEVEVGSADEDEDDDDEEYGSKKRKRSGRPAAAAKRKQTVRAAAGRGQRSRRQQEEESKVNDDEEEQEAEAAEEEEEDGEEQEDAELKEEKEAQKAEEEVATASKGRAKAKSAAKPRGKGKKAGKAGKTAATGLAQDPIQLSDEEEQKAAEETDAAEVKKKPRAKKAKALALLDRIRVSTARPDSKKLLGAHVSAAGGVHFAPHNAAQMGARAFAMDTRSKRRWTSPPYAEDGIAAFKSTMAHYGYSGEVVIPHGSYLMNLGSPFDSLYEKSRHCLAEELQRCQQLGIKFYNFHPGRCTQPEHELLEAKRREKERKKEEKERKKRGEPPLHDQRQQAQADDGGLGDESVPADAVAAFLERFSQSMPAYRRHALHRLIDALNWAHTLPTSSDVCILLETMAGGGSCLGSSFEELRYVIDRVHDQQRIGVCLDTCHVFAASSRYDIRTAAAYERTMRQLQRVIGLRYVKAVHLNDSKMPLSSQRDRHENIGDGEIGITAFRLVMNDPRWDDIPIILETPCKTDEKEKAKREKKEAKEREAKGSGQQKGKEEEKEEDEGEDEEEAEVKGGKKGNKKGGKSAKGGKKREAEEEDDEGGDDDADGEDGEEAEGGKLKKKPKEKEDWVKSYSEEIDMLYSMEGGGAAGAAAT